MSVETFQVRSESGKIYTARRITSRINTSNLSGNSSIEGSARNELADGKPLNMLPDGRYSSPHTGEVFTRV